ncbi:MAG: hypothetical protein ACLFXM_16145 [Acidimicrobiia bacterium]
MPPPNVPDRVIPAEDGCGCPACEGRPLDARPRGEVIRDLVARARSHPDHNEGDELLRHAVHEDVKPMELLVEGMRAALEDQAAGRAIDERGRAVTDA